jgi:selenide,water dikinase
MIAATTQLNTPGRALACLSGVHAMTDVTGFGLLGHLVEICKASGVSAKIDYAALPLAAECARLCSKRLHHRRFRAQLGELRRARGSSRRNNFGDPEQALLTDPQTSGGLLVACAPEVVTEVLAIFCRKDSTTRR